MRESRIRERKKKIRKVRESNDWGSIPLTFVKLMNLYVCGVLNALPNIGWDNVLSIVSSLWKGPIITDERTYPNIGEECNTNERTYNYTQCIRV